MNKMIQYGFEWDLKILDLSLADSDIASQTEERGKAIDRHEHSMKRYAFIRSGRKKQHET